MFFLIFSGSVVVLGLIVFGYITYKDKQEEKRFKESMAELTKKFSDYNFEITEYVWYDEKFDNIMVADTKDHEELLKIKMNGFVYLGEL